MATYIKTLKDVNDDVILPKTSSSAIIMADGTTSLETKIDGYVSAIEPEPDSPAAINADTLDGMDSSAFALAEHTHNDRYYTESEIDTLLTSKADLASPTFTGIVAGITASMVGLGNVTNESKAEMFTNPTLTGTATLNSTRIISDSASTGTDVYYIWSGTQAQYDAISTKDANTLYFIVG